MDEYSLVLLDPRHFHAELAAQGVYPEIGQTFRCSDLKEFSSLVESGRVEPAKTIVVLAGRNDLKAGYALAALRAGCHVLADKPLVIDRATLETFERACSVAEAKGLAFSDMMTERMNHWNGEVSRLVGSAGRDSRLSRVEMRSVHHFFKTVGGRPLVRPVWYYDTAKQGEGIVDVTTHLLDNVFWQCFPDTPIAAEAIEIVSARRWPTHLTPEQFLRSTGERITAPFDCFCNGEFVAMVGGVEVRISVEWRFEAPPGGGDTSVASFVFGTARGDVRSVELRNDETTGFRPRILLNGAASGVTADDPGHESHFSLVVKEFLSWLKAGRMPSFRRVLLRTKYRTLVSALESAGRDNGRKQGLGASEFP